jgi:hypothetical protein
MMINFIHVSGKRMIAQRTDGFLRGITSMGAMAGSSFMEYVPLHLNALERQSQPLVEWTEDWFGSIGPFRWLSLEDWFHQGHFEERCIWFPAPATADAALEQLAKVTHKHPNHMHLIVIPRLMTFMWRKCSRRFVTLCLRSQQGRIFGL